MTTSSTVKYFSTFSFENIHEQIEAGQCGGTELFKENIPCSLKYRMENVNSDGEKVDLDILEVCNAVFLNELQYDSRLQHFFRTTSASAVTGPSPWDLILKISKTQSKLIFSTTLLHPICQEALNSTHSPLPLNVFLEIVKHVDPQVFSLNCKFLQSFPSYEWLTPHLASTLFKPLFPLFNPLQNPLMLETMSRETVKYFMRLRCFDLSFAEFSMLSDIRSDSKEFDGVEGISLKFLAKIYTEPESEMKYDHIFLIDLMDHLKMSPFNNSNSNNSKGKGKAKGKDDRDRDRDREHIKSLITMVVEYQNWLISKEVKILLELWTDLHKNDHIEYRFAFIINHEIIKNIEDRKMKRFLEERFLEFESKLKKEVDMRRELLSMIISIFNGETEEEFEDVLKVSSTLNSLVVLMSEDDGKLRKCKCVNLLVESFYKLNFFKLLTSSNQTSHLDVNNCIIIKLLREGSTTTTTPIDSSLLLSLSNSYTYPEHLCNSKIIVSLLNDMLIEFCGNGSSSFSYAQIAKIRSFFHLLDDLLTIEDVIGNETLRVFLTKVPGLISDNFDGNFELLSDFNITNYSVFPSELLLAKMMDSSSSFSTRILSNSWGLASLPLDVLIVFIKSQKGLFSPMTAQLFWSLHPNHLNNTQFKCEIWEYVTMEMMVQSAGGKQLEVMKIINIAASSIHEHLALIDSQDNSYLKKQVILICKWLIMQEMHALSIWGMLVKFPHKAAQISEFYGIYTELESISRNELCKWIKTKTITTATDNPHNVDTVKTLNALLSISRNLPLSFIRVFFSNSYPSISKQFKTLLKTTDPDELNTKITRNFQYIRGFLRANWDGSSSSTQSLEIWQTSLDMLLLLNSDGSGLRDSDSNEMQSLITRCFVKSEEDGVINSVIPQTDSSIFLFILKIFSPQSLNLLK